MGGKDWERVPMGARSQRKLERAREMALRNEPLIEDSDIGFGGSDQIELNLYLTEGIENGLGKFTAVWWDEGWYSFHYSEGDDFNYRYDFHPRPTSPVDEKHFHEPPKAEHRDDNPTSCITHERVELVVLAALQMWRDAWEQGDLTLLQQPNQP